MREGIRTLLNRHFGWLWVIKNRRSRLGTSSWFRLRTLDQKPRPTSPPLPIILHCLDKVSSFFVYASIKLSLSLLRARSWDKHKRNRNELENISGLEYFGFLGVKHLCKSTESSDGPDAKRAGETLRSRLTWSRGGVGWGAGRQQRVLEKVLREVASAEGEKQASKGKTVESERETETLRTWTSSKHQIPSVHEKNSVMGKSCWLFLDIQVSKTNNREAWTVCWSSRVETPGCKEEADPA